MREIGGYFELDRYRLPMLHEGATALNCGRSCLAYLIESRKIRKLAMPYFMCDVVTQTCRKYGVAMRFYHIGQDFLPEALTLEEDEWLYAANYYGHLTRERLLTLCGRHQRVILDNAQAYFSMPLAGVDTLYTCRKFFGVSDGAFLYTDTLLERELPVDQSFERVRFVLGRYERSASEFYRESAENNVAFDGAPVAKMSKLTYNMLHGIDYEAAKRSREANYAVLAERLDGRNRLSAAVPEGPFAYPLWVDNGPQLRDKLREKKIYVPTLWPNVLEQMPRESLEWDLAQNILPVPCDQRYGAEDMLRILGEIDNV